MEPKEQKQGEVGQLKCPAGYYLKGTQCILAKHKGIVCASLLRERLPYLSAGQIRCVILSNIIQILVSANKSARRFYRVLPGLVVRAWSCGRMCLLIQSENGVRLN